MSRHYLRTPFLVTQLVCAHIDLMLLTRVEELVSQPNSPNLYWALSALPRPFIDLRPSIEMEERFLQMTVSGLDDLEHSRTNEQWLQRAVATFDFYSQQLSKDDVDRIVAAAAKPARGCVDLDRWRGQPRGTDVRSRSRPAMDHPQSPTAVARGDGIHVTPARCRHASFGRMRNRMHGFYQDLVVPALYAVASVPNSYLVSHAFERRVDASRRRGSPRLRRPSQRSTSDVLGGDRGDADSE